jgi:hypothetical protein
MNHIRTGVAVLAVLLSAFVATSAQTEPKAVPATPENAAAFLGEWTVTANGQYGPLSMGVTLKVAEGKVVGELTAQTGKHTLADISKVGNALYFGYVFDYQGMPIDTGVTLTPKDKTVEAYIAMAGGAAEFTGTATKK